MSITVTAPRDLARESDEALFDIYSHEGSSAARDELVERYMPFARKLAARYLHTREPQEDLVQVACIGLLNAIERFDPEQGRKFTTFAAPTILGEIKRYFRDKGWTVHVPRDLQERALAVSRRADQLSAELGRSPKVDELADALDCTIDQAVEAIEAADNYQLTSLDAPATREDEDSGPLAETLGREDEGFELAEERQAVASGWAALSDLERRVLGLRLLHGLTQRQISRRVGYSQMHVSRLLRRSMQSLNGGRDSAVDGNEVAVHA